MNAGAEGLTAALGNIVVIETGDERGEFAALLLASLGAQVIKIEPLEGSPSRRLGPFAAGVPAGEQSLFFWRYNLGKKSVALALDHPAGVDVLKRLAARADVIIDAGDARVIDRHLPIYHELSVRDARLIVCTITPFGLDGPWRDFRANDLTQLAMGGIMGVCGYDPRDDGVYDTPPIAPGMWQSYHLGGEYAALSTVAALNFREFSGTGQFIDVSIHEAINTCTELAMPTYIYAGKVVKRQTARHAGVGISNPWLHRSGDGGYVNATVSPFEREFRGLIALLDDAQIRHDLRSEAYDDQKKRGTAAAQAHINGLIDQLVASMTAEEMFHRAQAKGLGWAPVRRPENNLDDPHFQRRGSFAPIHHPELGRELYYPASVATDGSNRVMGPACRAPHLGEHTREVLLAAGLSATDLADLAAAGAI